MHRRHARTSRLSRRPRSSEVDPARVTYERARHVADRAIGRGRIGRGLDAYLRLLAARPRSAGLINQTGDLMARAGRHERAVSLWLEAAAAWTEQGFDRRACALYRKVLRLDPDAVTARAELTLLDVSR